MDNLCGSVAASCVVTYVLGIGDRHLENICLTPSGEFTSNLAIIYCGRVVDAIRGVPTIANVNSESVWFIASI